jgi:hypothetical protein
LFSSTSSDAELELKSFLSETTGRSRSAEGVWSLAKQREAAKSSSDIREGVLCGLYAHLNTLAEKVKSTTHIAEEESPIEVDTHMK